MTKIDELIEYGKQLYDKDFIQTKTTENLMREYAEWYAKECMEQMFGGKCIIEGGVISWTSNDRTIKYTISCPNVTLENK